MQQMFAVILAGFALVGCASTSADYRPPSDLPALSNSRIIEEPRDRVWDRLIPALSRQFFVINTIERQSGLINVSYAGDPAQFVDCGTVTINTSVGQTARTFVFEGASERQLYVVPTPAGLPINADRRMNLEGRINLIVEAVSARQTRVTASTRYVLTRTIRQVLPNGEAGQVQNVINFNSGGGADFIQLGNQSPLRCRATGRLEADLIALGG